MQEFSHLNKENCFTNRKSISFPNRVDIKKTVSRVLRDRPEIGNPRKHYNYGIG